MFAAKALCLIQSASPRESESGNAYA